MTGKISEDADVGTVTGNELVPVVAGGSNKRTTPDGILGRLAAIIHAATSKSTPVDADEIGVIDSAASNVLNKLTWANLKATLKTYFDTLYCVIPVAGTWTPDMMFGSGNTGITYAVGNTGTYVKIWKFVFCTGSMRLSSKGSSTGNASIGGIPFPSDGNKAGIDLAFYNGMSGLTGVPILGLNVATSERINVYQSGAASSAAVTDASFGNSARIDFAFAYIAAAT